METVKTWTMVRAKLPETPLDWSIWVDTFEEFGIEGTLQEEKPPALVGYAHSADDVPGLTLALEAQGAVVETDQIEEQNWAESWKQFFKPVRIGQHWVVRPTWEPFDVLPGDREIVLDPGQAFGTGDHPTTRMCLELLELAGLEGQTVADIGCGSGILSVGAVKLGAASVVAVDNDPPSIESSLENAERNGTPFEVLLGTGFEPLGDRVFDVVVSNIISATLIRIAPVVATRIRPGGQWIVSGIIRSNWPDVLAAAEANGFALLEHREEGEWVAAQFRR